jgi:spore coat protein A, manganese oxidase
VPTPIPFTWTPEALKSAQFKKGLPIPKKVNINSNQKEIHVGVVSRRHVFGKVKVGTAPAIHFESDQVWGYGESGKITSPGPTLIAKVRRDARVRWINSLTAADPRPFVEPPANLQPAGGMHRYSDQFAVVHLHGAHVPWQSDGYPIRDATTPTVMNSGEFRDYEYPFYQPGGATLWYHDHVMDASARNVYAGLAGMVLLRHEAETTASGLNLPKGEFEIPLVIQDRAFTKDGKSLYGDPVFLENYRNNPSDSDPIHPGSNISFRDRFIRNHPDDGASQPSPEFKGDVICVNGRMWPKLTVKQARYRFRIVNGSNSRVYALRLTSGIAYSGMSPTATYTPAKLRSSLDSTGLKCPLVQIGNDAAFLPNPLRFSRAANKLQDLVLAPGERADILIDFGEIDFTGNPGRHIYLTNHALEDARFGNGGDGPIAMQTDVVMRFDVGSGGAIPSAGWETTLNLPAPPLNIPIASSLRTRQFAIKEFSIPLSSAPTSRQWKAITFQSDIPRLGPPGSSSNIPQPNDFGNLWAGVPPVTGPMPMGAPVPTENPQLRDTEIWEFWNISPDVHPIHLHHSPMQIVERLNIKLQTSNSDPAKNLDPTNPELDATGKLQLSTAPANNPMDVRIDDNERGWKDTIRANAGQVTRIIVRFDDGGDPDLNPNKYKGKYVWHCHILEHEDMGMMRPLEIQ